MNRHKLMFLNALKRLSVHPENCSALSKHMISAADTVLKSVVEHLLAFTTQLDTSADPIMALSVFSMDSAPGQKLLRLVKNVAHTWLFP